MSWRGKYFSDCKITNNYDTSDTEMAKSSIAHLPTADMHCKFTHESFAVRRRDKISEVYTLILSRYGNCAKQTKW